MDARVVVGVGNIYASEALFRAGLRPSRRPRSLKHEDLQALILAVRQVLSEAIDSGGSTIRDYRGADGRVGEYQQRHFVYDRAGEACRVCKSVIKAQVMGGRSTFWCPTCQS
jgi:formamidopyrimidine-DNA glycosylase